MTLDDRCEICGRPSRVVLALVLLADGTWAHALVHVACEENRAAKRRFAGAAGWN